MNASEIHQRLSTNFGPAVLDAKLDALQPWIQIAPDAIGRVGAARRIAQITAA